MNALMCGLGFHKWIHIGYDVWIDTFMEDQYTYVSHRKCVHCEKRDKSMDRMGIPPEVHVSEDEKTYVDNSVMSQETRVLRRE